MSVINITSENFETEVIQSDKPVILDFWAPWCGPCKMFSPIIDDIAAQRGDVKAAKINVDEEPELAERFGVRNIPTVIVVKGGVVTNKSVGALPKAEVLKLL